MAKVKTKLTINAFRSTQSMLPFISFPRIVCIDEGSSIWKPTDIPKEPLFPPPPRFIIYKSIQQVIYDLK